MSRGEPSREEIISSMIDTVVGPIVFVLAISLGMVVIALGCVASVVGLPFILLSKLFR